MYSWQQGVLFLAQQENEIVCITVFICLRLLGLPNSNNEIIHVLSRILNCYLYFISLLQL